MTAKKLTPKTSNSSSGAVSRTQWLAEHGREDRVESLADERERRIFNNAVIDLYSRQHRPDSRRRAS